jgi:riboflavin synthase
MFTGIIEEVGRVQTITNNKISIQANTVLADTKIGDSIAVNGVCLTVTKLNEKSFDADISPETMRITALNELRSGDFVNLERAMPANGRFGGHIDSGHTDGKGRGKYIRKDSDFYTIELEIPADLSKYVVKKGSITVNGISLTVADIRENIITIAVIPHTYENTNLKYLEIGNYVNIETDIIAKYVEKFLSTSDNKSGISMEFLMEHGF